MHICTYMRKFMVYLQTSPVYIPDHDRPVPHTPQVTYTYEKRPVYVKTDLHIYGKKPQFILKCLFLFLKTHTSMNTHTTIHTYTYIYMYVCARRNLYMYRKETCCVFAFCTRLYANRRVQKKLRKKLTNNRTGARFTHKKALVIRKTAVSIRK